MKTISRFFTFLFFISFVFVAQAATIVFHNNTENLLTIEYNGEFYPDIKSGDSKEIYCSMLRRITPFMTNLIPTLKFKYKIGNDGVFKEYNMDSFVKQKEGIDTEKAVLGNYTRNINIEGDSDNPKIYEEINEDPAGFFKYVRDNTLYSVASRIKKIASWYGTIRDDKTFDLKVPYIIEGVTKDLVANKVNMIKGEQNLVNTGATRGLTDNKENIKIRIPNPKGVSLDLFEQLACEGEIIAVKEREQKAKIHQKEFLYNINFLDHEMPLSIAFAGSGGGVRARISTTGFIRGAVDAKLFDCATYFSALSGSVWALLPFIAREETNINEKIDKFEKQVIYNSSVSENWKIPFSGIAIPIACYKDMKDNYYRQQIWKRPHGVADAVGVVFVKALFKEENDTRLTDYTNLHFSDAREKVESGSTIIPILEIRAERKEPKANMTLEPCFFTPWEFGGRYFGMYGACINIKTFGSNFEETKDSEEKINILSEKKYEAIACNISKHIKPEDLLAREYLKNSIIGPEPSSGSICGVLGSAFTVNISQGFTGPAQQNIDPKYKFQDNVFNNSPINCEFNSFMHGKKYFKGYDNPLLYLHDAGIVANIPIISLNRRPENLAHGINVESAPDIIIVFDASDTKDGTIGEQLLNNKIEMKAKGLPFPKIKTVKVKDPETKGFKKQLDPEIIDQIKKNNGFYIFDENPHKEKKLSGNNTKYKKWEIPIIIYMTLFNGQTYNKPNATEFKFDFKDANTFNFGYDKKYCKGLMDLTSNIIKENINKIKFAMEKRRVVNLKRDLSTLKDINASKEKQMAIRACIKNKEGNIEKFEDENRKLQDDKDELERVRRSLDGSGRVESIKDNQTKIYKVKKKLYENIVKINQANNSIAENISAFSRMFRTNETLQAEKEMRAEKLKIIEQELKNAGPELNMRKSEQEWRMLRLEVNNAKLLILKLQLMSPKLLAVNKLNSYESELLILQSNLITKESNLIAQEKNLEVLRLKLIKSKLEPFWLKSNSRISKLKTWILKLNPEWRESKLNEFELNQEWLKSDQKWLKLESEWLQSKLKILESNPEWLKSELSSAIDPKWLEPERLELRLKKPKDTPGLLELEFPEKVLLSKIRVEETLKFIKEKEEKKAMLEERIIGINLLQNQIKNQPVDKEFWPDQEVN